jgi:hypothetical protein
MTTPFDALVAALREAGEHDLRVEAPPEAVLWCDPGREFHGLQVDLRGRLPGLLTLGDPDATTRSGPALWLRAAAGRAIAGLEWPAAEPPILYLPGVGRETLRAVEDCPEPLKLLAWFAFSGAFFGHVNGKDWTLRGFLAAKRGGIGLDVAEDQITRMALVSAAAKVFSSPLADLRSRRIDAAFLDALLVPDLPADMLDWLDGRLDAKSDPARFAAFAERARRELKIDPVKISRTVAAQRLAGREGSWSSVWARFEDSPQSHYAAIDLLSAAVPPNDLLIDRSTYPSVNDAAEDKLRQALLKLADVPADAARAAVLRLEQEHGLRRQTVWARMNRAPLALGLRHLAHVASAKALPADDVTTLAEAYAANGALVDSAAIDALAAAPAKDDRTAVVAALRAVYLPWLEAGAAALQALAKRGAMPAASAASADADAVVFVDGLRMDLGLRLAELLKGRGAVVQCRWRWTGFPTVTATCKPFASPAAKRFRGGDQVPDDFYPTASDGKFALKPVLERELKAEGWEIVGSLLPDVKAWSETGNFDSDGHSLGVRLVDQIERGLSDIADMIVGLAKAGRRVRIITDHGWLLLPGGLPRAKLDSGLTDTKWSRCALVKEGAAVSAIQLPWTWTPAAVVATAPGVHAFREGQEYAHGGLSPQESVVPELVVEPLEVVRRAAIVEAQWVGLRLRVTVDGGDGLTADLRLGAEGDGLSVLDKPRELDADGRTSLLVTDDGAAGQAALLIMMDRSGNLVAIQPTTVGGT